MNDEVVIITPELSPSAGGVGDYTLRLLEHLPNTIGTKILVAQIEPISLLYQVARLGTDRMAIRKQLPGSGGKILLQYSAYGFDRHGFPRKLLRALIDWKRETSGRLVIMFHEIWTFWPFMNKNFIVQFLHRRAIKRLLECADEVFTSTQSQAEHLRHLSPHPRVKVLPVGSNIRRNDDVDLARLRGWAILFGRQSTRLRALKKMRDKLASLADARALTKIVSIGVGADSAEGEEERTLLDGLRLSEGFEQRGRQSEREISELLRTSSFGILAQDELSLTKSGTFMAYATHELNVLADFANSSKPEPVCWLVAPGEIVGGMADSELKRRAAALLGWQQRVASWEMICENFIKALDLERSRSDVGTANV
jgi:glycosyltransferase involved in cell wall biosynthesis